MSTIPRQLRRDKTPWSRIRSPRLREIRERQWAISAMGGPCWRTTDAGRAAQAALQAAVETLRARGDQP